MRKSLWQALVLSLTASVSLSAAAAQDAAERQKDEIATLEIDDGVIMVSDGGQAAFVSGVQEQRLLEKTRLMVTKDSRATVRFDNGCDVTYDEPGVYEIDGSCKAIVWWGGATPAALIAATGVTVGIGALIVKHHGEDGDITPPPSPPPVSR